MAEPEPECIPDDYSEADTNSIDRNDVAVDVIVKKEFDEEAATDYCKDEAVTEDSDDMKMKEEPVDVKVKEEPVDVQVKNESVDKLSVLKEMKKFDEFEESVESDSSDDFRAWGQSPREPLFTPSRKSASSSVRKSIKKSPKRVVITSKSSKKTHQTKKSAK